MTAALERPTGGLWAFMPTRARRFFVITHGSLALLGLALAVGVLILTARPGLRQTGEAWLMNWLLARQPAAEGAAEDQDVDVKVNSVERATASDPKELPKPQAAAVYWLSKKYRVAPEPLAALVAQAYELGNRSQLDPPLILAVMAIESGFNPFAQSSTGTQGLMQIMTQVHGEKFENFGGRLAAFDPATNLRVGVNILREYVARAGSVQGGLRYYVGAAHAEDDGGYVEKVMAEYARLYQVTTGHPLPPASQQTEPPAAPVPSVTDGGGEKTAALRLLARPSS